MRDNAYNLEDWSSLHMWQFKYRERNDLSITDFLTFLIKLNKFAHNIYIPSWKRYLGNIGRGQNPSIKNNTGGILLRKLLADGANHLQNNEIAPPPPSSLIYILEDQYQDVEQSLRDKYGINAIYFFEGYSPRVIVDIWWRNSPKLDDLPRVFEALGGPTHTHRTVQHYIAVDL